MPSSRKHTSTSKQHEQSTFLRLIDSLSADSDFCTAVQSVDDINRPRFLNQTIHTQAASVGFIIYRDGIRSVPDREQTDTEPRFIGLGQVGLLLQYNRSISEYNVGRS